MIVRSLILSLALMAAPSALAATFEWTALAPADTDVYVHVEDAAAVRRLIATRPIGRWVRRLLDDGDLVAAWTALAGQARMQPTALFDTLLGRRAALLSRGSTTDGTWTWAIVAEPDVENLLEIIGTLRCRRLGPRHGVALAELPEQSLLLGVVGDRLLIGPRDHAGLFDEVVMRAGRVLPGGLDEGAAVERGRRLGGGSIAALLRHDAPAGWSVLVGSVNGDAVTVRHAARFAAPPLARPVTKIDCSLRRIRPFEHDSLLVVMEPTDIGPGEFEQFLESQLDHPMLGGELRQRLGSHRMLVVGEAEGRRLQPPMDMLGPTFAVCVELKDAEGALGQLDAQMHGLAGAANKVAGDAFALHVPEPGASGIASRHIDLGPMIDVVFGNQPLLRGAGLNWTVARGADASWIVVASHRDHMDDVAKRLRMTVSTDDDRSGRFDNVGAANGARIGRHLRTWADQADRLAEPGADEAFNDTIDLLCRLCAGIDQCTWRLARPSRTEIEVELDVRLAPPRSAEPD